MPSTGFNGAAAQAPSACIGILALQGAYAAHQRMVERMGATSRLVRSPDELEGIDALILPGGESSALLHFLQQDGFLPALAEFVRSRPCLGTCAGVILLAEAVVPQQACLGALHIEVQRNAYGRQRDSSIRKGASSLPGGELEMVFIRAPRIVKWGTEVEVLASLEGDPVLVRQGHLLGCTFHPELSDDTRIHQLLLDLCAQPKLG